MAITGSVVGGMTVYTIAKLIMQTKSKSEISSIEDKMNINAVADMLTKFSDDVSLFTDTLAAISDIIVAAPLL